MNPQWLDWIMAPPWPVDLLARTTAVLALGWIAHVALRKANPRWRTLVWRAVAVGLILMPAAMLALPDIEIRLVRPSETKAASRTTAPPLAPSSQDRISPDIGSVQDRTRSDNRFITDETILSTTTTLWLFAIALSAVRYLMGMRRANRLLSGSQAAPDCVMEICERTAAALGCRRPSEVRMVAGLSTPLLTGIRRPVLVLPETVCGQSYRNELPGILAHELAHLRANDLAWGWIIHWISVVLWFHPLAWRMRDAHALACEQVSDAVSADYLGDVRAYSRTLARVAIELIAGPEFAATALPMARPSEIQMRLERLKDGVAASPLRRRERVPASLCAVLAFAMLGVLRLGYAAIELDHSPARNSIREILGHEAESPSAWGRGVRLTVPQGAPAVARTLDIWNWAGGTMVYDMASSPSGIIEIEPASGRTSGEVIQHQVRFKTESLKPGQYLGTISIIADAPNAPVLIPVEIIVTPDPRP